MLSGQTRQHWDGQYFNPSVTAHSHEKYLYKKKPACKSYTKYTKHFVDYIRIVSETFSTNEFKNCLSHPKLVWKIINDWFSIIRKEISNRTSCDLEIIEQKISNTNSLAK